MTMRERQPQVQLYRGQMPSPGPAALGPAGRPAPARPATRDCPIPAVIGQPRQLTVHRVAPQGHQPVEQRVPYPQRLAHHRDLRPRRHSVHRGRDRTRRPDSHHHPGRDRPGGQPGSEPEPAHPRVQLCDQVKRRLELLMLQQPGHHQQRRLLRNLHPVPALSIASSYVNDHIPELQ